MLIRSAQTRLEGGDKSWLLLTKTNVECVDGVLPSAPEKP